MAKKNIAGETFTFVHLHILDSYARCNLLEKQTSTLNRAQGDYFSAKLEFSFIQQKQKNDDDTRLKTLLFAHMVSMQYVYYIYLAMRCLILCAWRA